MLKMPGFKPALEFTIKVSPLIALTLTGIKVLMTPAPQPVVAQATPPVVAKAPSIARPTPQPTPAPCSNLQIDARSAAVAVAANLDNLLPVPDGFVSCAKVFLAGLSDSPCGTERPRDLWAHVEVWVPEGISQSKLDNSMRVVARQFITDNGAHCVRVEAHIQKPGGKPIKASNIPAGRLTISPFGKWKNTGRVHDLADYKVVLWHKVRGTRPGTGR